MTVPPVIAAADPPHLAAFRLCAGTFTETLNFFIHGRSELGVGGHLLGRCRPIC
jgi:hypothetical protein